MPHQKTDQEIMILGGGPSLDEFWEDIRQNRENGMPLVTTNGAYNWCIQRGIKPSAQVIVDGREFNKRFVTPHVENCHYFIASQCHPATIEAAPRDQVILWHSGDRKIVQEILENHESDIHPYYVRGGATVMLRVIPLMEMLGYSKMHIYGFDSCLMDGRHHCYDQPENDSSRELEITVGDKTFICHPWMFIQAQQFIEEQKILDCELAVYGDGLIANIIKTGAEISKELYDGSISI